MHFTDLPSLIPCLFLQYSLLFCSIPSAQHKHQAMEVAKRKASLKETLMQLEKEERDLRVRLQSKREEFDGEQILKGDAVE